MSGLLYCTLFNFELISTRVFIRAIFELHSENNCWRPMTHKHALREVRVR